MATGYTNSTKNKKIKEDIKALHDIATTNKDGLMSAGDKKKLDGVATNANNYSHPSYTARTGVPTSNQTPGFGGTFSVSQPVSDATGHITAVNSRTITIPSATATTSANGLMSSSDKKKLDGVANNANNYSHPTTSGNKHVPAGGSSGQVLKWSADGTASWVSQSSLSVGSATKANGVIDYNGTAPIQIGYSGDSLGDNDIYSMAAYSIGNDGPIIKDVEKTTLQSWLGLKSINTSNKIYLVGTDGSSAQRYSTADNYINNGKLYSNYLMPLISESSMIGKEGESYFSKVNTKSVGFAYNPRGYGASISYTATNGVIFSSTGSTTTGVQGIRISNSVSNIKLSSTEYIYFDASYVSTRSSNVCTSSDPKIKKFTTTIDDMEDKLLELYDRLTVKSYYDKISSNNEEIFGLNAEEVEDICLELGIDPEHYNFINIQYNYMSPSGDVEDSKYYTKFRSLSYNDLFALGILKNKKMMDRMNSLESRLAKLEEKENV